MRGQNLERRKCQSEPIFLGVVLFLRAFPIFGMKKEAKEPGRKPLLRYKVVLRALQKFTRLSSDY